MRPFCLYCVKTPHYYDHLPLLMLLFLFLILFIGIYLNSFLRYLVPTVHDASSVFSSSGWHQCHLMESDSAALISHLTLKEKETMRTRIFPSELALSPVIMWAVRRHTYSRVIWKTYLKSHFHHVFFFHLRVQQMCKNSFGC